MQLRAKTIASQAVAYKKSSVFKYSALTSYLQDLNSDQEKLNSSAFLKTRIKDPYLSQILSIIKSLNSNFSIQLEPFQSVLDCPLRYEGVILNWHRAYKLNKVRENLYKVDLNYAEDKEDVFHPLLYYKIFKKYLDLIIKSETCYLGLGIDNLWKSIGKDYCGLKIKDCFWVLRAKSFSRCNLKKSVEGLRKYCESSDVHVLVKYFLVKFEVELAKLTKKKMKKRIGRMLEDFHQIVSSGLGPRFIAKAWYKQSELFYELEMHDKALTSLRHSNISYYSKKSIRITELLIEQQMMRKASKLRF